MPVSKRTAEFKHYWRSECGRAAVYVGDCRVVLPLLEECLFHAVVTDPPYGLEFMGKEWDAPWKNEGRIETCDESTDRSHPGRDGTQRVCYGNNRVRRVDARQRRAGEMSDPVKSKYLRHNVEYVRDSQIFQDWFHQCASAILRVSKPGAHLLSFGGTRMYHRMVCAVEDAGFDIRDTIMWVYGSVFPKSHDVSKAIDRMYGAEREVVGEKKAGMSSGNTFGMLQDGNNVSAAPSVSVTEPATEDARTWQGWVTALKPALEPIVVARRPLVGSVVQNTLDHACGGLNIDASRIATDEECARLRSIVGDTAAPFGKGVAMGGNGSPLGRWPSNLIHDGSKEVINLLGNAARFFYTAKADEDDRPHGKSGTVHPTVKPLDLMRYLVKLVCVRGGLILDPFMGSGSTGCAALLEGMRFVGVEQSQEYADIAVGRLRLALESAPPLVDVPRKIGIQTGKGAPPPPQKLRGM